MKPIRYRQSDIDISGGDADEAAPVVMIGREGYNWLQLCWPSIGFCAGLIGIFLATQSGQLAFGAAIDHVRSVLSPRAAVQQTEHARVLIVTRNPDRRLQVVATLSPRGFEPLLAENAREAGAQLASHSGVVRLAVLDGALPDAAAVERALRAALPAGRIIVLQASSPREAIGSTLLNRL